MSENKLYGTSLDDVLQAVQTLTSIIACGLAPIANKAYTDYALQAIGQDEEGVQRLAGCVAAVTEYAESVGCHEAR